MTRSWAWRSDGRTLTTLRPPGSSACGWIRSLDARASAPHSSTASSTGHATRASEPIELGVTTSNPGAVAFYEGLGFVDTGERGPLREGSSLTVQGMSMALR